MKKRFLFPLIALAFLIPFSSVFAAMTKADIVKQFGQYLTAAGLPKAAASSQVDGLINFMEGSQKEIDNTFSTLDGRVQGLRATDPKKNPALKLLSTAKSAVTAFKKLKAVEHISVYSSPATGVAPSISPDSAFDLAKEKAEKAMADTSLYLISPARPGAVPEGDLMTDFVPQLIRQLFRFAYLAILISLVVSGILWITAMDNEEKVTKAKHIIYYSLIGFAFVTLAFAIVKGITDIDFFRFI